MTNPFDYISDYYDLLYEDKNTLSEVEYLISLFNDYGKNINSILEFGSGTGRHAYELAKKGFEIYGIERSKSMVESAKLTNGFKLKQGDFLTIDLSRQFDSAISLFHVFSYLVENKQIKTFLKNVKKHTKPEGIFIFDFWYSPAVLSIGADVRVKRFNNDKLSIIRIAEPINRINKNLIEVNYTFIIKDLEKEITKEIVEVHPMRHFSIPELEYYFNEIGMEFVQVEEWLTKEKPSIDTWGVCAVVKNI